MKRKIERMDFALIVMILVTTLLVGTFLISCGHYAYFLWTIQENRIKLSDNAVAESDRQLELMEAYYECELDKYRPPDINIDFIEEGGE